MAKKVINSYYEFDPVLGKVSVLGYHKLSDFFLITNVTTNTIIYNFADNTLGGTITYSELDEKSTVDLTLDTNTLGTMSNTDTLQIIVDTGEMKMEVSDSLLDPVHKIRVSTPENLIDTDFEYGLQPTKWETLELANNVPSFYTSDGDLSLTIIDTVEAVSNSAIITVYCSEDHALPVGTPIDVQGLSSRTAEGKFLISASPTTKSFTYSATAVQTATGEIGSIYTTITPGTFYTGSQIPFNPSNGIVTDEGDPSSTITVTTEDPHGFAVGNQFYMLNTVGGKGIKLTDTTTLLAPDGRPYVDHQDDLTTTITPDLSKTETKQMKSRYSHKFSSTDVDVGNNNITWTAHGLRNNDVLFYMPGVGDTAIGGLGRFQRYRVYYVDANTIGLRVSENSGKIPFSSSGTSNYGQHSLHLAYEVRRTYAPYRNSYCYVYTAYSYYGGNRSGWDLRSVFNGGYGLGYTSGQTVKWVCFSDRSQTSQYDPHYYVGYAYTPRYSGNFNFVTSGGTNTFNRYNIFEDFTRFSTVNYNYITLYSSTGQIRAQKYYYRGTYNYYPTANTEFYCPMVVDTDGDSLYASNHGLNSGETISITTASGNLLRQHVGSTSPTNTSNYANIADGDYSVDVISNNRFKVSGKRLSEATGSYTIEGITSNPTANSFHIAKHGLNSNTTVIPTVINGGVFPTTNSGQIIPNSSSTSSGTNVQSWGVLNTKISSWMGANTSGLQDMVTATNENSTRVFNSGVASGNSSMTYYDLHYTTNSNYYSTLGTVNAPNTNLYMKNLKSTRPYNILSGTTAADRQNLVVATDWTPNANLPYYFWTRESNRASASEYWYGYFRDGFGLPSQGSMAYSNNINQQTVTVGGNTYKYALTAMKHVRSGCKSTVAIRGYFMNTSDWNIHTTNAGMTRSTNNNTYWYGYWNGSSSYRWKDIIEFGLVFSLLETDTKFNVVGDYTGFMTDLLTDFDTNYQYPSLISGNQYIADIISGDRIALKSGGVTVNLTDSGTKEFQFQTKAELGIIDGTYTASSVTEDTFAFNSTSKVFGTTIDLDATTVNSDYLIQVNSSGTHSLITGTQITYSSNSNTALSNLADATTYYIVAIDDQWIALCATADDAVNRDNYIQITAGTGVHKISTSSILGVAEADGTVAVETGSNVLKGTGTLFKRYFKTGDTIYIKDTTNNPGELVERNVTSISDDSRLTVNQSVDFTNPTAKHFLETKVYTKPDGFSVHRPFDGGVEIAAGTSPYSQVMRQTRKYFRYQSGKGIQTSLAINFNPPVTLETLSGTGGLTPSPVTRVVTNDSTSAYIFDSGTPNDNIILYRGGTYTFTVNTAGHPFYFTTDDNTGFVSGTYVGEYTSGVTGSRVDNGTVTFVVPGDAPSTLYYQCANHQGMNGTIQIEDFATNQATANTKYPHRLKVGSLITVANASDTAYNGNTSVSEIVDDFTFKYGMTTNITTSVPNGIIKYNMNGYSGAETRAGMYDFQNGFFFEFDGNILYCCRRSSVTQLSGTVSLVKNSGKVVGTNKANFTGQLSVGEYIVLRGQSYKITKIASKNELYVQPQFKGLSTSGAIVTKTEDVKVAQSDWNLDKCDGSGSDGFVLNINKIQMAYMDYSWYGAGKIRFGFKDAHGHVRYVHQFIHNNRLDEAYMRSGNIPAKYEIESGASPDYAPTLFHWGTSVIMDGTFDDDKAYLFTAPSKSLSFTNGETSSVSTSGNSSLYYQYNWQRRSYDWWVRIPVSSANADEFYSGLTLYTADGALNGEEIDYTQYSGGTFYNYIYITRSRNTPAVYPSVTSGTALSLGAPAAGGSDTDVNLGTDIIPLVSLRLAPSVDANLSGNLGERDIINRMQLQLNQVGLILTHDCEVKLILNGDVSSPVWANVANPSLSQLIKHTSGDTVTGGTEVFSFRATGGATDAAGKKLSNASNFDLGDIIDMGNSILGGDGTFPNGPDILTVAVQVVDTGGIGASNPFTTSGRVTWSESQA